MLRWNWPDSPNIADGILRETEIVPVTEALAPLRPQLGQGEVTRALAGLAGLGLGKITAIVSATDPLWCEVDDEIGSLIEIAPALPFDIEVLVIASSPPELREAAEQIRTAQLDNLTFLGWKEFADGALGAHTAALHEPFSDDPGNRGILRLDREHAEAMAQDLSRPRRNNCHPRDRRCRQRRRVVVLCWARRTRSQLAPPAYRARLDADRRPRAG